VKKAVKRGVRKADKRAVRKADKKASNRHALRYVYYAREPHVEKSPRRPDCHLNRLRSSLTRSAFRRLCLLNDASSITTAASPS
jgi:hypothetical protein